MRYFPFLRPPSTRRLVAGFPAVIFLGAITFTQAAEPPRPAPPPSSARVAVDRALRELDRFLDHHPLLEHRLRLRPALTRDQAYLRNDPELGDFLAQNPAVLCELNLHPRYFLYRALLRQANAPLRYSEIAQLRPVFEQQPDLERALILHPDSIRDPAFQKANAPLRDFLTQHPVLGQEFLPHHEPLAKNT